MNHATIIRNAEDLRLRWADLRDGLEELDAIELPNNVNASIDRDDGTGWLPTARIFHDAIDAWLDDPPYPDRVDQLLAELNPYFTDSREVLQPETPTTNLMVPLTFGTATALAFPGFDVAVRALAEVTDTDISVPAQRVLARFERLLELVNQHLRDAASITTAEGFQGNIAGIRNAMDDVNTFPVLTQDLGYNGGGWGGPSGGGGGGGTAVLGQVVSKAITEVLGRRPRLADPKSFVAALNQSFNLQEVEGHTLVTWNQRAQAGLTELGAALTGAQASLYQRARAAMKEIDPLLERIYPLITDADPEEADAVRAIVRNLATSLVNELGREGGPRVSRANDLFDQLRGQPLSIEVDGDELIVTPLAEGEVRTEDARITEARQSYGLGALGRLGYVFGLTRERVNTITEEQNLTDYLILRDYVESMYTSWLTFSPGFASETDTYFGTQLVHVTRSLSVVTESVDEVTFAMDSVFLRQGERDTTSIDITPRMFVSELLSWVHTFAAEEGPRLIQDAGKHGARTIVPTLNRLADLVRESEHRIEHPAGRHPRVVRALVELRNNLRQAADLVSAIR